MPEAKVSGRVEALLTPTDPVAGGRALLLHLLVLIAEVAAVQTPGQVVPQLGEVVLPAWHTLGRRGGCAVRGHVHAWRTFGTLECLPSGRILVLIGGGWFHHRRSAQGRWRKEQQQPDEELWREPTVFFMSEYYGVQTRCPTCTDYCLSQPIILNRAQTYDVGIAHKRGSRLDEGRTTPWVQTVSLITVEQDLHGKTFRNICVWEIVCFKQTYLLDRNICSSLDKMKLQSFL